MMSISRIKKLTKVLDRQLNEFKKVILENKNLQLKSKFYK